MDARTRPVDLGGFAVRDRDVMNLLDQLELFALENAKGRVTQKDYWLFVYNSMESGELMTKAMRAHLQYKLGSLGAKVP